MKLLLDENLSHRLIPALQDAFPQSSQTTLLNLNQSTDRELWEYAKQHHYAIVTMDADFHEYNLLFGGPPLVIWLRFGNQPKSTVIEKLLHAKEVIESAEANDIWCIEIY